MLRDFNVRTTTNQAIILSNNSNPNAMWLNEDLVLANRFKRNLEDLTENLYGTELVNISSSQYLIICNGLTKWPNYN